MDAETTGLVARHVTRLPWLPTVVIASHDPHVLARTGGRVITLRDGVRGSGSPPDAAPSPDARGPATAGARTAPALPTASAPAVDVSGLRIRFGAHRVVEEASFAIPPGAMLALRGRSGSGKTSVGRAIAGLLVPEAGTLDVAGARIPWAGDDRIRSEKPLVIPVIQDSRAALHPGETVRTALVRAGRAAGRQGLTSADPAELLARFGLDPRLLERRPHQLSGGQRQRVAIARAMASAPTLLVCDEVTASLDATAERMVLDALDEARTRTGVAILLITHSPAAADRAHRVLTLDAGRLA
nr:ATP-binding cassette domain-containing protein [Clavibacter michiganensis]